MPLCEEIFGYECGKKRFTSAHKETAVHDSQIGLKLRDTKHGWGKASTHEGESAQSTGAVTGKTQETATETRREKEKLSEVTEHRNLQK